MRYYFYLTIFTVYIMSFNSGMLLFWLSPMVPKLDAKPPINPLKERATTSEISVLVSIGALGGILGPVVAFIGMRRTGIKPIFLVADLSCIGSLLTGAFGNHIGWFYFCRCLGGITIGIQTSVGSKYLVDISDTHIRGRVGTLAAFSDSLGAIASLSIGPFVSTMVFNLSLLVTPVLFIILWFFMPESPNILIGQGKDEKAFEVLKKLQVKNAAEKISTFKHLYEKSRSTSCKVIWTSKYNVKAFSMASLLMIFQPLTGTKMLSTFTQSILLHTINVLTPEVSAIAVAIVGTVVCPINPLIVDRLGRKAIMIMGLLLLIASSLALGYYFHFGAHPWVSLVSLMLFKGAHMTGVSTNLCWLVILEILPSSIKNVSIIVAQVLHILTNYLVSSMIPFVNESYGIGVSFAIFSCAGLVMLVHVLVFIPETKGKNSEELETIFNE